MPAPAMPPILVDVGTPDYVEGASRMPQVSVSGSRDAAGVLHLSIVNLHPDQAAPIAAVQTGTAGTIATAETLTAGRIDTRIEFGKADPFVPVRLDGVQLTDRRLSLTVPARSVTMVTVR